MRINIWISSKGTDKPYFGEFPYEALSLVTKKYRSYENIIDVYDELLQLYDDLQDKDFSIGNALFMQSKYFVDTEKLINVKSQNAIRKYNYCKLSNTPPFPSIQSTPFKEVNNFFIIDEEIGHIQNANK